MVAKRENGNGSLGRSGLFDWMLQRVTGLVIALYILCLVSFFATTDEVTYQVWSAFMGSTAMKVSTILVFLSLSLHGWIGVWVIATDYMTDRLMGEGGDAIRGYVLKLCAALAVVYFVGGMAIIWGVV